MTIEDLERLGPLVSRGQQIQNDLEVLRMGLTQLQSTPPALAITKDWGSTTHTRILGDNRIGDEALLDGVIAIWQFRIGMLEKEFSEL